MSSADLDILLVQLQDGRPAVRIKAARALAKSPDKFARKSLLKALKDQNAEVRYWSVVALQSLLDNTVLQEFLNLFSDSSRLVRLEVVRIVGRSGAALGFQPLVDMLGDPDADVRSLASLYLSRYKENLYPRILEELTSSNWNKKHQVYHTMMLTGSRGHAAITQALRKKGLHREVIFWLLKLVGDLRLRTELDTIQKLMADSEDEDILRAGLEAIGKLGMPESVPTLIPWLHHPSERVRDMAIQALTDLGEHALSHLLSRLEDDSRIIRFGSAKTLSQIGDLSIAPLLEKFHERDREGRFWILNALRRMKAPVARSIFLTLSSEEEGDIQILSIQALSDFSQDEEVLLALMGLLEHEQWKIRNEAARSIVKLKPEPQVLMEKLNTGTSNQRYWVIQIMQGMQDPRFYPALVSVFDDPDWVLRTAASDAIRQMNWHQKDLVIEILTGKDENRIFWMTRSLRGERDRSYLDSLIRCLSCRQSGIVENVQAILKDMGTLAQSRLLQVFRERWPRSVYQVTANVLSSDPDRAREAVLELLRGDNREEHYWASQIAAKVGEELCEAFIPLLESTDWKVRSNAVQALGSIGSPRAVPSLAEVLQDEYTSIRRQVVEAFGKIGDKKALAWVLPLIESEDLELKLLALETLGKLGGAEVYPSIVAALMEDNWLLQSQALRAIGRIGDVSLVSDLLRFSANGLEDLLEDFVKACIAIGDPRLGTVLRQELAKTRDLALMELIIQALGRCGDASDLPLLIQYLKEDQWSLRRSASDALGSLRLQDAIPALKEALVSADSVLRVHIRDAMRKILGEEVWQKLLRDHVEASRTEQAETLFRKASECLSKRDFKSALKNINQAIALSQKIKYVTLKARAHAELKEYPKAEKAFHEILRHRPDDIKTLCNLALLYFVQGESSQAEQIFAKLQTREELPEDVTALIIRTRQKMKT